MRPAFGAVTLAAAAALLWAPTVSPAGVLDFEDLTTASHGVSIEDAQPGYGGFTWSESFCLVEDLALPGSGFDQGTASGHYAAYNAFEDLVSVEGAPFNFVGAYLTAAWNEGLQIRVTGLLGGSTVYDTTIVTDPFGPHWFSFDYFGIDTLSFESSGGTFAGGVGRGTHFALDDFEFELRPPAPEVPEPASVLLLGGGLAGLALRRRRRR